MAVIVRYSECVHFEANCVKVVEARPVLSAIKCSPKNLVLAFALHSVHYSNIDSRLHVFMTIFKVA